MKRCIFKNVPTTDGKIYYTSCSQPNINAELLFLYRNNLVKSANIAAILDDWTSSAVVYSQKEKRDCLKNKSLNLFYIILSQEIFRKCFNGWRNIRKAESAKLLSGLNCLFTLKN